MKYLSWILQDVTELFDDRAPGSEDGSVWESIGTWLISHTDVIGTLIWLTVIGAFVLAIPISMIQERREGRRFRDLMQRRKAEQEASRVSKLKIEAQRRQEAQRVLHETRMQQGLASLEHLQSLTPREFEETIAFNLKAWGYTNVELTSHSGDLGVDVFGTDPDGRRVIVQCKRFATGKKVGTMPLQMFWGAMRDHGVDRGLFFTTSAYTQPAIQYARNRGIILYSGENLNWRLKKRYAYP